ncbi:MAG: ABC transporter substrate-binding protein, partial [Acidimicrobiia bacterium]|nr:ABC transporter substrate-binding protein [Acidimicrobiia bacterium]
TTTTAAPATTTTTAGSGGTDATTTTTAAPTETTVEPMTGGEISFYITEPPFLDPQLVQDNQGFEVVRLLFDGLTLYSPAGGAVVPGVAESWEANDDLTVWTFNLRDTQWPDGSAVTADDFIYAWGRAADPDLSSRVYYHGGDGYAGIIGWSELHDSEPSGVVGDGTIEGLRAVDDTTLEITLNATNSLLPKILAHPVFSPVQKSVVEADPEAFNEMPTGNGPYKMTEPWNHDVNILVERSDTYYGTPGLPDAIEFRVYSTQDAAYLDFQAGNLDVVRGVPDEQLEQGRIDLGDRLIEQATGSFTYMGLPWTFEPFKNPDIRRALLMAIDTEAINERIFVGRDTPRGFVPGVANGAIEDACEWCRFDPTAAKELYDSAGGVPGDTLQIVFNSGAGHEQWVEAVANDWNANLGITANFQGFEWAAYLDYLFGEEPNTDPFRLGWGWDYPSGYNFLAPLYACDSGDNLTGFCSPELDAELEKVITSLTEEDGIPALKEAQRIVGDLIPVIPITYGRSAVAYTEDLSNVAYTDFGFFIFEDVVVDRG